MSSLPVIQKPTKIKSSRASRWRAGALILVHVLIALHIAHWRLNGTTLTPVEPSEAMAFSRAGVINAGLIFFASAILLTAVLGRFFCGWACHVLALQDLCRWMLLQFGIRPRPLGSRFLRIVPGIAFAYMFLWPAAYRLFVGDSFSHFESELTTSHFWATFPGWVIGGLTFFLCGFVIVYLLGAKGFCAYACPYGAVFAAAERIAPLRIRVTDACAGCGHCTAVCSSNVRVHEEVRDYGMVVSSDCMKCLDCVSVCPQDALYYGLGPVPIFKTPRRVKGPSWAEEGLVAASFVATFLTFRGLYGQVPFLMSLGSGAILATLVLFTARLLRRPDFTLRRFRLKRAGRLERAGVVFLVLMAGLFLFWGQSAYVRYHAFLGERSFRQTTPMQLASLNIAEPPSTLDPQARETVERALGHLERVRDWGLVATVGNAGRLAWLYHFAESPEQLAVHAQRAIARGETVAWMYQLLAYQAFRQQDVATTAEAYEQAIAAAPDSSAPYVSLGVMWARRGNLAAAWEVLSRGLAAVEDSPQMVYNSALVLALGGSNQQAIAFFERALALDSGYLEARENLAGMLASVGRYEESLFHYRQALMQSPRDAVTRYLAARVLVSLGREQEAREELEESLGIDPGLREAQRLLDTLN